MAIKFPKMTSGAPGIKKNQELMGPTLVKPFEAPKAVDVSPQFEMQKRLSSQRLGAQEQGQREALQRRFAQLGGGPSGASIKSEQNLEGQMGQQREQALSGIDMAKLAAIQEEAQRVRDLGFQGEQAQRGLEFQAAEAAKGRGLQQQQMAEAERMNAFTRRMSQQQVDQEKIDQNFNKAVAMGQMSSSQAAKWKEYYKSFLKGKIPNFSNATNPINQTNQTYGGSQLNGLGGGGRLLSDS